MWWVSSWDVSLTVPIIFVSFLLGLVFGSFINCWAWRYVNGESVMKGRSHCTSCQHELAARDLIPIFSWIALGGKCRYCGEKISVRCLLTEGGCGIVFALLMAMYGPTLEMVQLAVLVLVLLFVSLTDLDKFIIPNKALAVAVVARLAYMGYAVAIQQFDWARVGYYLASALGAGVVMLIIVLVCDRLFKRESMGGGDIKLYVLAALFFGWEQTLFIVVLSCVIGIVFAFLNKLKEGEEQETQESTREIISRKIPFGPSIAIACVFNVFIGQAVVVWYFRLISGMLV